MSRRSALIALFLVVSALTEPATALVLAAMTLAPIAIAQTARRYTNMQEPADA
ncbi:hypothetical protein [Actinomadura bangladeshensis]|uniref:Uncharacterized protein n=1 Tax=Actinomadura bangladeshensis TaxID=453573 RepID=A0A6L9QEN2_9ACTN|nr:hypothetical protein [Actinomadura bangladeshensis]NEA22634.1 hypothetical protein [Actinomadura bangladeshensis]